jgi:hypothetical protein
MARTKQLNMVAILKAYEAEAKRAERNSKAHRGEALEQYLLEYASKIRQHKQQAERVQA